MIKKKKLIIVGISSFAEIAYEYFTHDSDYEVIAFSVEKQYLTKDHFMNLPVVAFEELQRKYDPNSYSVFVAIVYSQLNRLRTRLYLKAKEYGYNIASYISSNAFVWRNVELGEHCFIFENNVLQPFVSLGNNVILWSGNHIGHHSTIRDHCFIASHVVISGHCDIGKNCFFGVNATLANNVSIPEDCVVGAGALILQNAVPAGVYKGIPTEPIAVDSYRIFKIRSKDHSDEMA